MAGITTAGIRTGIGDFGAAAQSLFGGFAASDLSKAYGMSGAGYRKAAASARENADLTAKMTDIQETQAERQIFKALGGTSADVASSGFRESGSALDILADSAQQGELQKSLIQLQGEVTEKSYRAQADAYETQASVSDMQAAAAKKQSTGNFIATGINAIAGIAAIFSDRRLKTAVRRLGVWKGYTLYRYRYLWDQYNPWAPAYREGVMAQEVMITNPDAVRTHWTGYYMVDYGKL